MNCASRAGARGVPRRGGDSVRMMAKLLAMALAVPLLVVGAIALAVTYQPDRPEVEVASQGLLRVASALAGVDALRLPEDLPGRLESALSGVMLRFGASGVGLLLLVGTLLPGRKERVASGADKAPGGESFPVSDPREARKARKIAARLARRGEPGEAAEICFSHGLLEEAAGHFIAAEEFGRAAEIRHDQNRFLESAELHLKGGNYEAAGLIFGQQGEFARSADSYLQAGNKSVAAEMFEQARDYRRAANYYSESGCNGPRALRMCWSLLAFTPSPR